MPDTDDNGSRNVANVRALEFPHTLALEPVSRATLLASPLWSPDLKEAPPCEWWSSGGVGFTHGACASSFGRDRGRSLCEVPSFNSTADGTVDSFMRKFPFLSDTARSYHGRASHTTGRCGAEATRRVASAAPRASENDVLAPPHPFPSSRPMYCQTSATLDATPDAAQNPISLLKMPRRRPPPLLIASESPVERTSTTLAETPSGPHTGSVGVSRGLTVTVARSHDWAWRGTTTDIGVRASGGGDGGVRHSAARSAARLVRLQRIRAICAERRSLMCEILCKHVFDDGDVARAVAKEWFPDLC